MKKTIPNPSSAVRGIVVVIFANMLACGVGFAASSWTITQLTNNDTNDHWPAISGTNVVWLGWDGSDSEIYSNFAGQLPTNSMDENYHEPPAISGTNVVWAGWDGSDWEIYSNFAGQLTNNSTIDDIPAISGTNVVWAQRDGSDWEICSNFTGQLTNNSTEDLWPAISGTNVVWEGWDGSDWEIYSNFAGQLTNNSTDDRFPAISGTNVVWQGYDGSDWEIYSNFAGQLTNNSTDDVFPAISGTNVVWVVGWGTPFWVGGGIRSNFAGQLFDQHTHDRPAISGTNVVWAGWDGSDWEIYMATYARAPVLFVVIPGINDNGTQMLQVANALSDSPDSGLTIAEVKNQSDDEVRNLVMALSREAQANGKDVFINIDMDLDNPYADLIVPQEFKGNRWNRATEWAGHKANIVSQAFHQVVPEGRRVLFAHSAGGNATYDSLQDCNGVKMYDDINILNGRTSVNELSTALGACKYNWSQVKIFTSQADLPASPPIPLLKKIFKFLNGSISNKDAAADMARQGAWTHLHCNEVWVDESGWMAPEHSTLRNYYDCLARFEVYTQTMNGAAYENTFIGAMSADWSSLILESTSGRTASGADQSRPKVSDTHSPLLLSIHSPDARDKSRSQEVVKTPQDEDSQAVTESVAATAYEMRGAQQAVAFMLFEAGETIDELGPENFDSEESAIELTSTIDAMLAMLDDGLYFEALAVLDNDILQRIDGCANTGEPDEDDWITSVEGQALVYPLVVETMKLLERLN